MTFEKKLKALRKKNRMSQEEMAERLNVSRQAKDIQFDDKVGTYEVLEAIGDDIRVYRQY